MYTLMNFTTLNYLKENIDENFNSYYNSDNTEISKNIDEQFEKNSILIISDEGDLSKDDLENAISLYEHYKFLPVSLASEERFWTYLTHTSFWEYMCKRWPTSSAKKNEIEFIKTRYFFSSKGKNFYRNGLSRLWWLAHITYDSTNEDQYYYTRIAFTSQDLANLIMDTPRLSRNIKALKAVLKNILRLEQLEELQEIHKIKNKRDFLRDIAKYVNLVGGVTIWDKLSEEEAYDIIKNFLDKKLNYIVKTNEMKNNIR